MKVLLVFFDTMRYDHASYAGYHRKTTPVLDQLAAEGTWFTDCYCTDVPTQPCYTATLSGRRGIKTGIVSHGQPEETISSNLDMLPMVLAKRGVLTAAVSTLYRFRRWFAQGFTHYIQPEVGTWLQHVTCEAVNREAVPWIKSHANQDFFLFLHYWDPHTPYHMVPKRYLEKFYSGDPYDPANKSLDDLRSRPLMHFFVSGGAVQEIGKGVTDLAYPIAQYDGEINYADEHFAQVLDALAKQKVLDDTIIIFTSDHGEALREHGVYFDHMDAYEQVAHVPLLIWRPGRVQARKVGAFAQHVDLAPTILEAFGVETPATYDGKSLWRVLEGKTARHRDFVVTNQGLWSAQRAYRTKKWTLMRTYAEGMLEPRPAWELFDRQKDRAETCDVSAEHPDVFAELKGKFLAWVDEQLGARPDPLRIAAEKSAAANGVKDRFERWKAARAQAAAMTPDERGRMDDRPGRG